MLYRKSPPTPPRLLLRIVATAGAGALLGVAACSSSHAVGLSDSSPSDASDIDAAFDHDGSTPGLVPNPDAEVACGPSRLCGVVALPTDAGDGGESADAGDAGHGAAVSDAADDGTSPCHPCGVIVNPDR